MRLVGVEQNRVAGGQQVALFIDADFEHALGDYEVFLHPWAMPVGDFFP
ncbi:hypothetical protein APX70_200389 [Pseudomonas syringae pv. maculicola]|uniref:Uncharacterized protein n=1 Tax=Pseudomonas syringae pv. maculicola TaxID=59511 RepID=A0A3M2WZL1_PSEYM|nr:hypothetical protein APX70_200389 [Pseudomonas syringae pv. maculicola]